MKLTPTTQVIRGIMYDAIATETPGYVIIPRVSGLSPDTLASNEISWWIVDTSTSEKVDDYLDLDAALLALSKLPKPKTECPNCERLRKINAKILRLLENISDVIVEDMDK